MKSLKPEISATAEVASLDQYQERYQQSLEHPEAFWQAEAERLAWFTPPTETSRGDFESLDIEWFSGGQLKRCVQLHRSSPGNPARQDCDPVGQGRGGRVRVD